MVQYYYWDTALPGLAALEICGIDRTNSAQVQPILSPRLTLSLMFPLFVQLCLAHTKMPPGDAPCFSLLFSTVFFWLLGVLTIHLASCNPFLPIRSGELTLFSFCNASEPSFICATSVCISFCRVFAVVIRDWSRRFRIEDSVNFFSSPESTFFPQSRPSLSFFYVYIFSSVASFVRVFPHSFFRRFISTLFRRLFLFFSAPGPRSRFPFC